MFNYNHKFKQRNYKHLCFVTLTMRKIKCRVLGGSVMKQCSATFIIIPPPPPPTTSTTTPTTIILSGLWRNFNSRYWVWYRSAPPRSFSFIKPRLGTTESSSKSKSICPITWKVFLEIEKGYYFYLQNFNFTISWKVQIKLQFIIR